LLGNWGYVFTLSLVVGLALLWVGREDRQRERGNKSQPTTLERREIARKEVFDQFEKYKR
jgi:hypothetical protein